ncbi:MAG: DUF1571 domain-containing protein [Pirellulales bacterium]|nr:DUF1571 domain-containing protein [Pirellulales bacterium]
MRNRLPYCLTVALTAALGLIAILPGRPLSAQETGQLVEPIFRVVHEEPAGKAPEVARRATIAHAVPLPPFDLAQRPGEHPLMPALRMAKSSLETFDREVQDYSAMLIKQERIDGNLGEQEAAYIKVRNQPNFGVYMFFLKPHKSQECLYSEATDNVATLYARGAGMAKRLGVMELDPHGRLAMRGQKYPITKLGLRNLITELIDVAENDVNFGECEVRTAQSKINGRKTTLITVVHPQKRDNFRFHKAELFLDNQLRFPIRYAAYLWPEIPGEQPPLEEAYTYLDLKINNGYNDFDFDRSNPTYFK